MTIQLRQIGPGMVQQIQSVCAECRGEGEVIPPGDRCKECKGKKVVQDKKVLEVHIDKGMTNGQKIVFSGEGDQMPGITPGDVIIILDEKPHEVFKRKGNNLFAVQKIPLTIALCGGQFTLTHLDDRVLILNNPRGSVIKPGDVKVISGEGMPTYKRPFEKGDLFLTFEVEFPPPGWIDNKKLAQLEALLPERMKIDIHADQAEEVDMIDFDPSKHNPNADNSRSHSGNVYDDEDEDDHRPGVQCAQH